MYEDRRDRLDAFLDREGLAAVWLAEPASFAWLTGGDNIISDHGGHGAAAAGYDGSGVTVVTSTIERERLRDEELRGDVIVESYPWYDSSLREAIAERSPQPAGADIHISGFERVDVSRLREPLSDTDIDRYRALGMDTAAAVESGLDGVRSSDLEREVAGEVSRALRRRDVRAPVLLVGGAERAQQYRHFTPSSRELGRYVIASVVGYRDGLHASVTRTVAFDPPRWFEDRFEATRRLEATALSATQRIGSQAGEAHRILDAIKAGYTAVDHPREWERHHQGGAAGFASREWKATPRLDRRVRLPMAFAWNPTIQGAKSEGTWLVEDHGIESLTPAGDGWPVEDVTAIDGDLTLQLPRPRVR